MEEKIKRGGGHKNVIVLIIIWLAFFIAIFSNQKVRDYIYSFFGYVKPNYFEDTILVSKPNGEFSKAKVYFDEKPEIYDIVTSPFSPETFFAATNYGIFVSSDSAKSWYHLDLPKEIGKREPVYRVFFNLNNPSEISILMFKGGAGLIYKTNDNFYSLKKSFEISQKVSEEIIGEREISNILPVGDNQYLIGTSD